MIDVRNLLFCPHAHALCAPRVLGQGTGPMPPQHQFSGQHHLNYRRFADGPRIHPKGHGTHTHYHELTLQSNRTLPTRQYPIRYFSQLLPPVQTADPQPLLPPHRFAADKKEVPVSSLFHTTLMPVSLRGLAASPRVQPPIQLRPRVLRRDHPADPT